ncbi:hypothetical protein [Serratia ureilytica]|uniref:hypothetical protein n=1 Tax=Serratia ureilytica TaxID=300181 RepID=UPI0018D78AA6|nr:hypothetical protein [Serratia ureilytica]MBH2650397.1 hypothetical protein [Serratia ureilytica]
MTAKQPPERKKDKSESEKTCFIIMPIADASGYDSGHFSRVYNHLIKPACEAAGFKPIRADDVSSSHFIVVDILKKIVESDLAICDLSGRNPNVLYELGLRQAFNKKTVLIKDNKTENIFDVQGFRYAQYDSTLRIDNVKNEILKISMALTETYEANSDINSIVQLLQIEPAKIDNKTELNEGDTVLFRAITDLKESIESLTIKQSRLDENLSKNRKINLVKNIKNKGLEIGEDYYLLDDNRNAITYGKFEEIDYHNNELVFRDLKGRLFQTHIDDPELSRLTEIPF